MPRKLQRFDIYTARMLCALLLSVHHASVDRVGYQRMRWDGIRFRDPKSGEYTHPQQH